MQMGGLKSEVRAQLEAIIRGDRIGTRVTPLAAVPQREPDAYLDGTDIPDWNEIAKSGDRRRPAVVDRRNPVDATRSHRVPDIPDNQPQSFNFVLAVRNQMRLDRRRRFRRFRDRCGSRGRGNVRTPVDPGPIYGLGTRSDWRSWFE